MNPKPPELFADLFCRGRVVCIGPGGKVEDVVRLVADAIRADREHRARANPISLSALSDMATTLERRVAALEAEQNHSEPSTAPGKTRGLEGA